MIESFISFIRATNYALYNGTVMCKPHHREAFLAKARPL